MYSKLFQYLVNALIVFFSLPSPPLILTLIFCPILYSQDFLSCYSQVPSIFIAIIVIVIVVNIGY